MIDVDAPRHTSSRLEQQVRSLTEQIVQLKSELAQARARVAALTTTDATGLLVWRAFGESTSAEIARATRYHREIGLVLVEEIDAAELADICRSQHRDCDLAGRTDAGEIALLLPETSLQGALVMAQRVRARAKDRGLAPRVGCAAWPQHGRSLTALVSAARSMLSGI